MGLSAFAFLRWLFREERKRCTHLMFVHYIFTRPVEELPTFASSIGEIFRVSFNTIGKWFPNRGDFQICSSEHGKID